MHGLGRLERPTAPGGWPYILCVMTTYLKEDAEGERAIEDASRAAYDYFSRLGAGLQYGRQIGR